ncbi:uncharacterized protein EV154DRAFT_195564 [Mucor mucedo]|uniref:uncharacterized protein n=1 Tax=Mucor mucedo TaxID=29922 RepID=UPI00221EDA41|nr:uncharacterized protein EV154DRAFT_195564 [Mucor mucedo]KAI7892236.1 hypothetical protein EV154DRAFT_195564 [Mucor mucedo]
MSERSLSPINDMHRRSLSRSPLSGRRGRSYSPRSRSSSSRSYSRSRSRSRSYSRHRRSRSRSRSPYRRSRSRSYHGRYYSRSPPPSHHRRSPPPSRRYRSRSPPPRRRFINKDCRVYVGNLPFEVTWHQLKEFMKEAGQVAHVDVLKLPNGRSKGCGVVEYRYPEDAKRAIHIMNKAEFMGRPVFVREDREYEHTGPPKDPRDAPDDCRLHVSNLPLAASWQDMKDLFRKAGRVLHTDIHTDIGSRRPNGNGTVIYDCSRTARAAIDMFNGYEWQGHKLGVTEGRQLDKLGDVTRHTTSVESIRRDCIPPLNHRPPPEILYKSEQSLNIYPPVITPPVSAIPTPVSTVDPVPYQSVYRYGGPETIAPPPPHLPPPPPMYTHMSLVGGPAANLPTHGHNQIFVNNLPFSTTWQDLIDLFRHVGPVVRSEILTMNGHPKGSGFVRFEDAMTCERAIEKFHGYVYGGRHLDIRLDKYSTTA